MAKKTFWGILVMALALGLVLTGCPPVENETYTYTVTYNVGDGSGTAPQAQMVTDGETITLPGQGDMIAPDGMAFSGWRIGGGGDYPAGSIYTVRRDSTFIAQWGFLITYDVGDGSGTAPQQMVVAHETITLPGQGDMIAPTRTSFSGWKLVGGSPYSSYPAGSSYYVYNSDTTFIAQWEPWAPQGISIGIISFAGDARNITSQGDSNFYFLDASGKQRLASSLNDYSLASESGTALYYAVHKALANLTEAEPTFSNDTIHSINLITFTDGLDNASFGASNNASIEGKSGVSSTEYAAYVKEQIGSRTIGGKPIRAYSIGVKGSDVTDENAFNTSLSSIASTEGNVHTLTNVSELEEKLAEIAGSIDINIGSKVNNFRMQTTQNDPGTVIRMTFDVTGTNPADAAASTRYIEGTLAYNNVTQRWSLTNIQYSSGISSDSGASIGGVASGSTVSFTFKNILGYDPQSDTAKQWFKSSDLWQINSEYSASGSTETTVNMDTMLVYLVLDASTSLNTEQIGQIRTAVNGFITTLYDRTHPQD